jgi:hypothetical protein
MQTIRREGHIYRESHIGVSWEYRETRRNIGISRALTQINKVGFKKHLIFFHKMEKVLLVDCLRIMLSLVNYAKCGTWRKLSSTFMETKNKASFLMLLCMTH